MVFLINTSSLVAAAPSRPAEAELEIKHPATTIVISIPVLLVPNTGETGSPLYPAICTDRTYTRIRAPDDDKREKERERDYGVEGVGSTEGDRTLEISVTVSKGLCGEGSLARNWFGLQDREG